MGATAMAACAAAADDVLTGERVRNPLTSLIGIPNPALRSAQPSLQVRLLVGNSFSGGTAPGEMLVLDGETTELALTWHQPVSRCVGVSLRVPLVAHAGGIFDSPIDAYHEALGLPDGGRPEVPNNLVNFEYTVDGEVFELQSDAGGFGDVSLWVRGLAGCATPDQALPWRVGVKLPSGDEDDWLGSGGTDVWADLQSPVYQPFSALRMAASIGVLIPGETDVLPTLESVALFGAAGGHYSFTPRLAVTANLDWHTALFDSELTEIGNLSGQLTAGFRYAFAPTSKLDVQFTEDILVDTATDIGLSIRWTGSF